MMWKDSYRLGIDLIDEQHYQLFKMVENQLVALETEAESRWTDKDGVIASVSLLKEHVFNHFHDEENYQETIQYINIDQHKKEHQLFRDVVLDYEKRFNEASPELLLGLMKELIGTLVTWLIYHVADTDQKIAHAKDETIPEEYVEKSYIECFSSGIVSVFHTMFGIDPLKIRCVQDVRENTVPEHRVPGDLFSSIEFSGDFSGQVIFSFSKELAFHLMQVMTFMEVDTVDEILCSAMAEISNIVSGNVATELQAQSCCCDITPPIVTTEPYRIKKYVDKYLSIIYADTGIGKLKVAIIK